MTAGIAAMDAAIDQVAGHAGAIAAMAGAFALAVNAPGPNFVAVVAGIGVATTLWIVACVLGLGLLLEKAPWLRLGPRWLGAAYLVWAGIALIRIALAAPIVPSTQPAAEGFAGFRAGLRVSLGNPKPAAFNSSHFVALQPAGPPVAAAVRRAKRWLDLASGGLFTLLGLRLALDRWAPSG